MRVEPFRVHPQQREPGTEDGALSGHDARGEAVGRGHHDDIPGAYGNPALARLPVAGGRAAFDHVVRGEQGCGTAAGIRPHRCLVHLDLPGPGQFRHGDEGERPRSAGRPQVRDEPGQSGDDGREAVPCLGETLGCPLRGQRGQVPRRIQVDLIVEQVDDRHRAADARLFVPGIAGEPPPRDSDRRRVGYGHHQHGRGHLVGRAPQHPQVIQLIRRGQRDDRPERALAQQLGPDPASGPARGRRLGHQDDRQPGRRQVGKGVLYPGQLRLHSRRDAVHPALVRGAQFLAIDSRVGRRAAEHSVGRDAGEGIAEQRVLFPHDRFTRLARLASVDGAETEPYPGQPGQVRACVLAEQPPGSVLTGGEQQFASSARGIEHGDGALDEGRHESCDLRIGHSRAARPRFMEAGEQDLEGVGGADGRGQFRDGRRSRRLPRYQALARIGQRRGQPGIISRVDPQFLPGPFDQRNL